LGPAGGCRRVWRIGTRPPSRPAPGETPVIATAPRTPVALVVALLAACVAPAQDADVYTRTLKATALIVPPTGGGTGWVVDLDRGLLLTNEHVVQRHGEV